MKKLVISLVGLMFALNLNAQETYKPAPQIGELSLYYLQITGVSSPEQALYVSRIINDCSNILVAFVDISNGHVQIVAEGPINVKEIFESLQSVQNIELKDRSEVKLTEQEYLEIYWNRSNMPEDLRKNELPRKAKMVDQAKMERAYGVAKEAWINQFPDQYASMFKSDPEKDAQDRLLKEQEIKANQENQ